MKGTWQIFDLNEKTKIKLKSKEHSYWRRQTPPHDSLTAWVIHNRQPLHFDNLAEEIDRYPLLARRHLVGSSRHAVSWLGVALLNRDSRPIGVIALLTRSHSRR